MNKAYYTLIAIFLVSCSGEKTNDTEGSEAYGSEDQHEPQERSGEEAESLSSSYLTTDCFNNQGQADLANLFQYSPAEAQSIMDGNQGYMSIMGFRWSLLDRFRHCKGLPDFNDLSMIEDYIGAKVANPNSAGKRLDLMEDMNELFLNVNPEFIRKAANLLIPAPGASQLNKLTFQTIYDVRIKNENRNLYYLNWYLQHYSLLEAELRKYATISLPYRVREDGSVFTMDYNEQLTDHLAYRYDNNIPWTEEMKVERSSYLTSYVSFWMRRHLDGSAEELLNVQRKILSSYDREWLQHMDAKRPNVRMTPLDELDFEQGVNTLPNNPFDLITNTDMAPLDSILELSSGLIRVRLDNGQWLEFKDNEYGEDDESSTTYSFIGYVPGHRAVVIQKMGFEFLDSKWIPLNGDAELDLGEYFANQFSVSPGGNYLWVTSDGFEGYTLELFASVNNQWVLVYATPFLFGCEYFWENDHTLLINQEGAYGKIQLPAKQPLMIFPVDSAAAMLE